MWPWLALALLSAIGGAGLALAQSDLKRMLAFSTITGSGFLVPRRGARRSVRARGRCAGAAADALAKGLLFVSLASAEAD